MKKKDEKKVSKLCDKKDAAKTKASAACRKSCGTCPAEPAPTPAPSAAPTGCGDDYYADVDLALTGASLRAALQGRVASPHDVVPYTSDATDTWDALYVLDADPSNADNVVASTASVARCSAAPRVSEFVPAASCTTYRVASPVRRDSAWRTG